MKINRLYKIFFLLTLILTSCSSHVEKSEPIDVLQIERIVSDYIYPAKVSVRAPGSILINLKTPLHEIYYESKLGVLRDKIILLVQNNLTNIDSLFINFDVKESKGELMLEYFTKEQIKGIIHFNQTNKMYSDFNDRIFRNFDGNKLHSFSLYLKVLKKMYPKEVVQDDYILLLYDYIDERQGVTNGNKAENILKELKRVIVEGKEWKDFDERDIDYFLNYR